MATTTSPTHGAVTAFSTLNSGLASLATSTNLVAGYVSEVITVTTPVMDIIVQGAVKVGTTPTSGTAIAVYVIPEMNDSGGTFPSTVTTGGATTFSTVDDRANACYYASNAIVSSATSNVVYPIKPFSVASICMGWVPRRFCLFVAHNSAVNLNASGHNLEYYTVNLTTA